MLSTRLGYRRPAACARAFAQRMLAGVSLAFAALFGRGFFQGG